MEKRPPPGGKTGGPKKPGNQGFKGGFSQKPVCPKAVFQKGEGTSLPRELGLPIGPHQIGPKCPKPLLAKVHPGRNIRPIFGA